MCQMSMKLPEMFDQNPPNIFEEILENKITTKMLWKLYLEPKCQGHSRNQKTMIWGTKNMAPQKKFEQESLSNWCDVDV